MSRFRFAELRQVVQCLRLSPLYKLWDRAWRKEVALYYLNLMEGKITA